MLQGLIPDFKNHPMTGWHHFKRLTLTVTVFTALFMALAGCGIQNDGNSDDGLLASLEVGILAGFVVAADDAGGHATGEAIKGAKIVLDTGEKATSGSDGRFTIKGVSKGDHQVSVYFPGDATHPALPHTFQSVTISNKAVTPVTLKISSTGGVTTTADDQTPKGQLFGTIESDSAVGLSGVTITLTGGDENPAPRTSAGDGTFSVPNVPAGVYTMSGVKSGFLENSTTVIVEEGKTTENILLRLSPAPAEPSQGKATITGTVVDGLSGKPLSVVTVTLDNGTRVLSNGLGQFTLTDITIGEYTITYQKDGYAESKKTLEVLSDGVIKYNNGAQLGTGDKSIPIPLASNELLTFEFHKLSTLAGTVFKQDGTRLGGYSFTIVMVDDKTGAANVYQVVTSSTVAATLGEWKVDNVPPQSDAAVHFSIWSGVISISTVAVANTSNVTNVFSSLDGGTPAELTNGYITESGKTTLMDVVIPDKLNNVGAIVTPTTLSIGDFTVTQPIASRDFFSGEDQFTWSVVPGASYYIFEIFQDNLDANTVTGLSEPAFGTHGDSLAYSALSTTSVTSPNTPSLASLTIGVNYYWGVRATNGSDTSVYSRVRKFRLTP